MDVAKKTIFLVDDDITNLTIGIKALEKYYNVMTLNSGTLLLKILNASIKNNKPFPDLILLDIDMPEMDGYEAISLVKNIDELRDIPIIFLTAKTDPQSEMQGLSLGAVDYITKPFSMPLLLRRIKTHIQLAKQRHELIEFNTRLQEMVREKNEEIVSLKNTIMNTITEMAEKREDIIGARIYKIQSFLRILLQAVWQNDDYKEKLASMDIELIVQSAQFHDLGKFFVDDNILYKPGKLTTEEFAKVKEHITFGETIIDKVKSRTSQHDLLELARIMTLTHHEKWDGSGYPNGLKGEEIHLLGRIMAIVDVYDALISDLPYKSAMSHEDAVAVIKESADTHFDPILTRIFLSVSDEFKKGTY